MRLSHQSSGDIKQNCLPLFQPKTKRMNKSDPGEPAYTKVRVTEYHRLLKCEFELKRVKAILEEAKKEVSISCATLVGVPHIPQEHIQQILSRINQTKD